MVGLLGVGWESEVYLIREVATGIERAAKLFFPHRNLGNKVARKTAEKLHKLRDCGALIQYVNQETITFRKQPVTVLISEYVEGELLSDFIARQPGKRLHHFEALHLLHALAAALEPVHEHREYHGDLHAGNVIIRRLGLGFDIKLIDLYHHQQRRVWSIQEDVFDAIKLFYDAIGGRRFYARQSPEVKGICRGLKHTLIAERFRNAGRLRRHLETL
ncbi:MAG: protein kinase, partial [Gammaproteobacteria bacterium]|nr:protein kinase [Gammaproteobacteria bacterium]